MNEGSFSKKIRSFVRREGRKNPESDESWPKLWNKYGFDASKDKYDNLFLDKKPVVLEIGFGDGANVFAQAKANPNLNFIGIDVYKTGALKLMKQLDENDLSNVRICCTDVVEMLKDFIPSNSLSKTLIFFPDPWPKKRHHKRRLLSKEFLSLLHSKLLANAEVFIATDWGNYAIDIEDSISSLNTIFAKGSNNGLRSPYRIETKFEKKAIREGRSVSEFHILTI